jgi:hypothetical protein
LPGKSVKMAKQKAQIENIYFLKDDSSSLCSTFDEDDENARTSTETQGKPPLPYKWDSLLDTWLCSVQVGPISHHKEDYEFDVIYSADDEVYDAYPLQAGRQRSASTYSSRESQKTVTDRAPVPRKPLSRTTRFLISENSRCESDVEDLEVEREELGRGKVEEVVLAGSTDTLSDDEVKPQDHKHNSEKQVYAQEDNLRELMQLEEYRYENTRNDISVHPSDEENTKNDISVHPSDEESADEYRVDSPSCITKDEKFIKFFRDSKNERAKKLYSYLKVLGEEINAESDD